MRNFKLEETTMFHSIMITYCSIKEFTSQFSLWSHYPYYRYRIRLTYPYYESTDKSVSANGESKRGLR